MSVLAPLNVYLVAENRLLREALLRLLQKRADFTVIGDSDSPEIAAGEIAASFCNVLLIDSLALLYAMRVNPPPIGQPEESTLRIVLFGMNEDREMFLKAVHAGVTAYLLKDASAADVISAVRRVAEGEAVCPPRLCFALLQHVLKHSILARSALLLEPKFNLTRRQQELVELLLQKLTNKEIAAKMNLSEFTVKGHVRRIMRQLEATNRYEAVEMIRANGFLNCA
jgi:two-component system, NarL family, response regulator LiaR